MLCSSNLDIYVVKFAIYLPATRPNDYRRRVFLETMFSVDDSLFLSAKLSSNAENLPFSAKIIHVDEENAKINLYKPDKSKKITFIIKKNQVNFNDNRRNPRNRII